MSECDDVKNSSIFDMKDMIVVKNIKNVATLDEKLQDIITEDTDNPLDHLRHLWEINEGQHELNITYEHDSLTFPKVFLLCYSGVVKLMSFMGFVPIKYLHFLLVPRLH